MHSLNRLTLFSIAGAVLVSMPLVSAPPAIPDYQKFLSPA